MSFRAPLRQNIASLFAVQAASYIAPLLTLPWLTRVLGPTGFGRLNFCVAVTSYFILFSDYGFNLSATRLIALHATDRTARSKIFWSTLATKLLLAVSGFSILLILIAFVHRFNELRALLLINYVSVIGAVLTPTWYFLGMERQAAASAIAIAAKLLAVPGTFVLVRSKGDIEMAALIPSFTVVVGGVACLVLLLSRKELDRAQVRPTDITESLKSGWHLFVSTASISLYQSTNAVVLGLVAGDAAVGRFSAAQRVVQASQGVVTPIGHAVFPRVSRLLSDSRPAGFGLIRKVLRVQGSLALAISALLFALAPSLAPLLYGSDFDGTGSVLRWLSALPFLIAVSNVLGVQTLLALGMSRIVSRILILSGWANIGALLLLATWYGAVGAAMAVAGTEFLVVVLMVLIVVKNDFPVFRDASPVSLLKA